MSIAQTAAASPPTPAIPTGKDPAKIQDAAQQFEALLLGQILATVNEGGGWLGSGEDSSSSCANGFAQEQLAAMMARQGGFGLSKLIAQGLERGQAAAENNVPRMNTDEHE
jgi:Rod binding domain-containing protein